MLEIRDFHVKFNSRSREAVGGISFTIQDGEILGLVGESGSGKSVTAMSIAGLLPRRQCTYSGDILLDGQDLLHADRSVLRTLHGRRIGVVFQEPMSAMNPLLTVGEQVGEVLRVHTSLSKAERREKVLSAMADVELPEPEVLYGRYPHELSGGQLQRAMIAAAIIIEPSLLLLDEPTTALDVTIQAQILALLRRLNREKGISQLFISHNLAVVRKLCSRVAVMQRGLLVECGDTDDIFFHPSHPYTKNLIAAIPVREHRMQAAAGPFADAKEAGRAVSSPEAGRGAAPDSAVSSSEAGRGAALDSVIEVSSPSSAAGIPAANGTLSKGGE